MSNLSTISKHFLAIISLLVSHHILAADFAVSPMMIELDSVPRNTETFSFTIFGRSDANLKLSLFKVQQQETGYMGFVEADPADSESMTGWINLENDRLRIRNGETIQVNGQITIPGRASGTHLVGVMVEEDLSEEELSGIALRVRYAVILNLRVAGSSNRRIQTAFEELAVVEREDGTYLEGVFSNHSTVDDWLVSQVQIRSEDNRLLDRVELKTASAWQREDMASRVFPGSDVRVYGKLSKPIPNGAYNVMVRNRFADKSQPVYRDTISFELAANKSEDISAISQTEAVSDAALYEVSPGVIPVEIRSNGTSFTTFYIENKGNSEITVDLPSAIADMEANGVSEFQFYPDSVQVLPNNKSRVVLKQQHIEDTEYGNITFQAVVRQDVASSDAQPLEIKTQRGS